MPLSTDSSLQAPCSRELSTPNPLPQTPVRHAPSHETTFCPEFVRRIQENTEKGRGVLLQSSLLRVVLAAGNR